jgi:hypothetical protein
MASWLDDEMEKIKLQEEVEAQEAELKALEEDNALAQAELVALHREKVARDIAANPAAQTDIEEAKLQAEFLRAVEALDKQIAVLPQDMSQISQYEKWLHDQHVGQYGKVSESRQKQFAREAQRAYGEALKLKAQRDQLVSRSQTYGTMPDEVFDKLYVEIVGERGDGQLDLGLPGKLQEAKELLAKAKADNAPYSQIQRHTRTVNDLQRQAFELEQEHKLRRAVPQANKLLRQQAEQLVKRELEDKDARELLKIKAAVAEGKHPDPFGLRQKTLTTVFEERDDYEALVDEAMGRVQEKIADRIAGRNDWGHVFIDDPTDPEAVEVDWAEKNALDAAKQELRQIRPEYKPDTSGMSQEEKFEAQKKYVDAPQAEAEPTDQEEAWDRTRRYEDR